MLRHKTPITLLIILLLILQLLVGCGAEDVDFILESTLEEMTQEILNEDAFGTDDEVSDQEPPVEESNKTGTEELESVVESTLKVHFLDVGQADSILIQTGEHFMLIDAGNNNDAEFVVKYLKGLGVTKLDYVVGTHPHEDHIGGLDIVIDTFEVGKVLMPKVTHTTKTFEDVLLAIKNKGLKITAPTPGSTLEIGEAKAEVLAPNSTSYEDLNNYSLVLRLIHGENAFLFTGDAEAVSEKEILQEEFTIVSDVLKVGHHGSSTSTTTAFLEEVKPDYAIISVGKDNSYGHPHQETLDNLIKQGIKIYRTDKQGTITITSDGQTLKFETTTDDK